MENKSGKNSVTMTVLLVILVIGLVVYIGYDKFSIKYNTNAAEENLTSENNTKNDVENTEEKENNEKSEENGNYVTTKTCAGVYSGTAALTQDVQTGQYGTGTLTIELKSDGTYELKKENMNGDSGTYTIIENALLLKTAPDTCGPGADCSAKYSQYLNISEDCSTISWGYGSYFFDPSFTLTKQN